MKLGETHFRFGLALGPQTRSHSRNNNLRHCFPRVIRIAFFAKLVCRCPSNYLTISLELRLCVQFNSHLIPMEAIIYVDCHWSEWMYERQHMTHVDDDDDFHQLSGQEELSSHFNSSAILYLQLKIYSTPTNQQLFGDYNNLQLRLYVLTSKKLF